MNKYLIQVKDVQRAIVRKGYDLFENQDKDYNLNLIGIRTANNGSNKFDDILMAMWNHRGWNSIKFDITTDPGLYYLKNPLNVKGTAILKEMQHKGMWKLGKHRNQYEALVQNNACTVVRDPDRDQYLDMDGEEHTGKFGINCHRSNSAKESSIISRWSAGCQVFANPKEFDIFLSLCKLGAANWGNSFSYSLLNENDL